MAIRGLVRIDILFLKCWSKHGGEMQTKKTKLKDFSLQLNHTKKKVVFVIPSELFPTQIRATCHGLSAAAGKIGAVIGAMTIEPTFRHYGLDNTLIVCGFVAFLGLAFTWFLIPETKGAPLVEENVVVKHDEEEGNELF
jgi:PHS family inorganic phosphate transporter-like MFS transporter